MTFIFVGSLVGIILMLFPIIDEGLSDNKLFNKNEKILMLLTGFILCISALIYGIYKFEL